jgi:putative flippase GtrA
LGLGVLAFGAELVVLSILYQRLLCPLWVASALAAELSLLCRFVTNDRFVFGCERPSLSRCGRFHAASAGSFAISWLILNASAGLLGLPYVAAMFCGTVSSFAWSALTHFLWVWRNEAVGEPASRPSRTRAVGRLRC